MIELSNLSVTTSDGQRLLESINLNLDSGRLHVIIGPNGSGKTTLLKTLHGEWRPSSGSVTIQGIEPWRKPSHEIARVISFVEADHLDPFAFLVMDVIVWGRWVKHGGQPSVGDLQIARECGSQLGIAHLLDRSIASISTGERKKTHLARSLASQCSIFSWDEPCGPLDIAASLNLMTLIRAVTRQGHTVIVTLHDIALALDFADSITLLNKGQMQAHGNPGDRHIRHSIEEVYGIKLKESTSLTCATL